MSWPLRRATGTEKRSSSSSRAAELAATGARSARRATAACFWVRPGSRSGCPPPSPPKSRPGIAPSCCRRRPAEVHERLRRGGGAAAGLVEGDDAATATATGGPDARAERGVEDGILGEDRILIDHLASSGGVAKLVVGHRIESAQRLALDRKLRVLLQAHRHSPRMTGDIARCRPAAIGLLADKRKACPALPVQSPVQMHCAGAAKAVYRRSAYMRQDRAGAAGSCPRPRARMVRGT